MVGARLNRAVRGMAAVTTGTLIAQVILVSTTPILARIYPPTSFGQFSVIVGVAAIAGPAAALKFDAALLISPSEAGARRLLRLGLLSALVVSALSGGVALCFEFWAPVVSWEGLRLAPLWIGLMVLATASYSVLTQAALRGKDYGAVARRGPVQSLATAASQLSLSLASQSGMALIGGQLIGRAFGFVTLFKSARNLFKRPDTGSYKESLRQNWRFPVLFAPSGVLNSLGSQLPLILIASQFGIGAAGELGMAQRFAFIPGTVLGASVGQVIAAEFASQVRAKRGSGRTLYLRASAYLALVGGAVSLLMMLVAPWLLPLCLGGMWQYSGLYVQAMGICVGLGLVASPLSQVYLIHQSVASIFVDLSRIALVVMAIGFSRVFSTDALGAIWLLYSALSVNYLITWLYGLRIVTRAPSQGDEKIP